MKKNKKLSKNIKLEKEKDIILNLLEYSESVICGDELIENFLSTKKS